MASNYAFEYCLEIPKLRRGGDILLNSHKRVALLLSYKVHPLKVKYLIEYQVHQMESNFLFNNFTIFSVLKLIFTQRCYRVLYLYAATTSELKTDFSSKISELSNNYTIPICVMAFDHQMPINRSKCEEPILNVILVNNLSSMNEIDRITKDLRPNEVNLILLPSYNKTANQVNFKPWIKSNKKLMIMSNGFIAAINKFYFNQIDSIPLQPLDMKATKRFIFDFFSEKVTMNGAKINVFMQHLPPKSTVTASAGGDISTGPDGCLSELLVKFLKASPNFWSDIGIMYPSFRDWIKNPLVAPRLYYSKYHKETVTSNFISSFNRT